MRKLMVQLLVVLAVSACSQPGVQIIKVGGSKPNSADVQPQAPVTPSTFTSIEELLGSTANISYQKTGTTPSGATVYAISFKQPIDHKNEAVGSFQQQLTLIHRGADRPTVLSTEGYENYTQDIELELTRIYDADLTICGTVCIRATVIPGDAGNDDAIANIALQDAKHIG